MAPLYTTTLLPTLTRAARTAPPNTTEPAPTDADRAITARGCARNGAGRPWASVRSKSRRRAAIAVLPTPTRAPSQRPSRKAATPAASSPQTGRPSLSCPLRAGSASVKATAAWAPSSAARSATAWPCTPAPRIRSRIGPASYTVAGSRAAQSRAQEVLEGARRQERQGVAEILAGPRMHPAEAEEIHDERDEGGGHRRPRLRHMRRPEERGHRVEHGEAHREGPEVSGNPREEAHARELAR